MGRNRRDFIRKALSGAGIAAAAEATSHGQTRMGPGKMPAKMGGPEGATSLPASAGFLPVQTPDLLDLPWMIDNGVKVFRLTAEPVKRQIHPRKTLDLWGYNGTSPGPTIQVMQGDRVRIVFENHLPEATSMHWHGFEIPNNMDGVPGIVQDPIPPGGRFLYEFTLHQDGTYFYHSHMAMQEMMGMIGAFIMHPKKPYEPRVNKDFVIILQEYSVLPNNSVPNTMSMEFNWLTFNGKAGPAITPLIVRLGDRVRIRLINIGMDHHPIHLHGNTFYVTGTEAGRAPQSTWRPENTVLVGVAQARDIEFHAKYPGDWMLHCHMPHHAMNHMSSTVGPMTRPGIGMPAGTPGVPMGEDYGPGLGRGLGVGSTNDQPAGDTPLSPEKAQAAVQNTQRMDHGGMQMPGMNMHSRVSSNANSVPGFPQDAYMEGPMMAMDQAVWKPENYGLRPEWSGFMQGMMTLVRVLPPDRYDKISQLIRESRRQPIAYTPATWTIAGANHYG